MDTINFTELLYTMSDDFFTSYRTMIEELQITLRQEQPIRFIHDEEKRRIHIYEGSNKKVSELDVPLLTFLYSFNEPKIYIEGIPGQDCIRLVPNGECLYQLLVLARTHLINIKMITKYHEL